MLLRGLVFFRSKASTPLGAPSDVTGCSPLGVRHLNAIEVARDDRRSERSLRLCTDLTNHVARRDVGEGKKRHLGSDGHQGRVASGAVSGLVGTRAVGLNERRLVHEKVGATGGIDRGAAGLGVSREDDPSAVPRRPKHLLGPHLPTWHVDDFTALETPKVWPFGNSERCCPGDVERPGSVVLDKGEAD